MAASFASSSRISAGRLSQLCSCVESTTIFRDAIRPGKSAVSLGKQREIRQFTSGQRRCSAWAAGQDVSSTVTTPKGSQENIARTFLPPIERAITLASLADSKSRGIPM